MLLIFLRGSSTGCFAVNKQWLRLLNGLETYETLTKTESYRPRLSAKCAMDEDIEGTEKEYHSFNTGPQDCTVAPLSKFTVTLPETNVRSSAPEICAGIKAHIRTNRQTKTIDKISKI